MDRHFCCALRKLEQKNTENFVPLQENIIKCVRACVRRVERRHLSFKHYLRQVYISLRKVEKEDIVTKLNKYSFVCARRVVYSSANFCGENILKTLLFISEFIFTQSCYKEK